MKDASEMNISGSVKWIALVQDRIEWYAFVMTLMKLCFIATGNYLKIAE
jgi:hypothetical protein